MKARKGGKGFQARGVVGGCEEDVLHEPKLDLLGSCFPKPFSARDLAASLKSPEIRKSCRSSTSKLRNLDLSLN